MRTPPYLKKGDKIGLVATARKVTPEEMQPAIDQLEKWGLEVVLGKHLFYAKNQFAGTDAERAADLQEMLDNDEIRAILCARGGYGTVRIIDDIDFSRFGQVPKWIIGYSDITVLHSHIQQNLQVETMHSIMPLDFSPTGFGHIGSKSFWHALSGEPLVYDTAHQRLNRKGEASGELVGGNLSILYSLTGTKSCINTKGKILFIEDLDEYLYHVDRMMMNLKRAGMLSGLKGLVVGLMSGMNDNKSPFGKSAEEIIANAVKNERYPVCYGFPAGHMSEQRALILGREVELKVGDKQTVMTFMASSSA